MTDTQPNLFTRDDTFFGVCEGLGEDLGINANWLRLGIAGSIFFAPVQVAVGYLAMGAVVALTRWIAPNPARSLPQAIDAPIDNAETNSAAIPADAVMVAANEAEPMPLAA